MSTQVIADRYAEAIYAAAKEQGLLDQVDADLASVAGLLQENADLARLWKHPVVAIGDKKHLVKQLLAGKVNPLTLNLILLMFDKKRGMILEGVARAFRDRLNAERRRATVKVTSAMPLDESIAADLKNKLASTLAKDIEMETAVDPTIIGGVVLQIEDMVIDNSLRGRLAAIRQNMN